MSNLKPHSKFLLVPAPTISPTWWNLKPRHNWKCTWTLFQIVRARATVALKSWSSSNPMHFATWSCNVLSQPKWNSWNNMKNMKTYEKIKCKQASPKRQDLASHTFDDSNLLPILAKLFDRANKATHWSQVTVTLLACLGFLAAASTPRADLQCWPFCASWPSSRT